MITSALQKYNNGVLILQFSTSFKMFLDNWNIQTALWLKRYCYLFFFSYKPVVKSHVMPFLRCQKHQTHCLLALANAGENGWPLTKTLSPKISGHFIR